MSDSILELCTRAQAQLGAHSASLNAKADAAWQSFTAEARYQPELAQLALRRTLRAEFARAQERMARAATEGIVEAARLGNQHGEGAWRGIVNMSEPDSAAGAGEAIVTAALGEDLRTAVRLSRQAALRMRIGLDRGMSAAQALERATWNVPGELSARFRQVNSRSSLPTALAVAWSVRLHMVRAYCDAFFEALAAAGQDEFVFYHPVHGIKRMSMLRDWIEQENVEVQPQARFRLGRAPAQEEGEP